MSLQYSTYGSNQRALYSDQIEHSTQLKTPTLRLSNTKHLNLTLVQNISKEKCHLLVITRGVLDNSRLRDHLLQTPGVSHEEWEVLSAHQPTRWKPTVTPNLPMQGQRLDTGSRPTRHPERLDPYLFKLLKGMARSCPNLS